MTADEFLYNLTKFRFSLRCNADHDWTCTYRGNRFLIFGFGVTPVGAVEDCVAKIDEQHRSKSPCLTQHRAD